MGISLIGVSMIKTRMINVIYNMWCVNIFICSGQVQEVITHSKYCGSKVSIAGEWSYEKPKKNIRGEHCFVIVIIRIVKKSLKRKTNPKTLLHA